MVIEGPIKNSVLTTYQIKTLQAMRKTAFNEFIDYGDFRLALRNESILSPKMACSVSTVSNELSVA